jgi:hypothetical protein
VRKTVAIEEQATERKPVWELLPEEFPYEDKGCEMFPSCLHCLFPRCLEEEPRGKQRFSKRSRAEKMTELRKQGKTVGEIAGAFAVSMRTVQRALKMVGEGSQN